MSGFDRVWSRIAGAGIVVAGVAVLLMVALVTVEVISRYFLRRSTLIADEYAGYLLVVVSFGGLAYTLHTEGHIRVDFVTNRLPVGVRRLLFGIGGVLGAIFVAILAWQSWQLIQTSIGINERALTVVRTPLWIPQLVIPIGLVLFLVAVIRYTVGVFAGEATRGVVEPSGELTPESIIDDLTRSQ